ncbi:hypothetical protein Bca52824_003576 [Brassica carinata]|uniref:Uncharacterized protein n=1 Tax=Brassica carinata TaxID=52824 RepID=A0A8X7WMD0_BRACI|nr:hypothetical protein Bca52824_003576 [Brassica carinata]
MKRKTTEGEVSDTYQNLANATKADLYVTPHDALNRIPIEQVLASAINRPAQSRKSLNLHKKVSCTTADGTKPKPQCWDVSYNEMLTRRRLMTPENRLSIQSL